MQQHRRHYHSGRNVKNWRAVLIITILCCFTPIFAQQFEATGNTDPNHQGDPWSTEVTVTFDEIPAKTRFQLPTLAIMQTENDLWYINGWSEAYDPIAENPNAFVEGESYEAINDVDNVHNRYWIESQNDARIVVRHRCAMYHDTKGIIYNDLPVITPFGEAGEWTDEWYIIHPDGSHIRKVRVYTHHAEKSQSWVSPTPREYVHELEGMYMWGGRPDKLVQDELEAEALTLMKINGDDSTINFDPYPLKVNASGEEMAEVYGSYRHSNIHIINTKSRYRPFRIGRPSTTVSGGFWGETILMTPYNPPHELSGSLMPSFPAGVTKEDGYDIAGLGQVTYWDQWQKTATSITEIWLSGFVDSTESKTDLVPLAKSWHHAPTMSIANQIPATLYGYDLAERAWLIDYESVTQPALGHFQIGASIDSPVVNTVLLVNNWGSEKAELEIDGVKIPEGKDFRMGHYTTLDIDDGREWKNVLVAWVKAKSSELVDIKIMPVGMSISVDDQFLSHFGFKLIRSSQKGKIFTFTLSVSTPSEFTLQVLNVKGEVVGIRLLGYLHKGIHDIEWKLLRKASGVFLYKLEARGIAKTGRLVFVKL